MHTPALVPVYSISKVFCEPLANLREKALLLKMATPKTEGVRPTALHASWSSATHCFICVARGLRCQDVGCALQEVGWTQRLIQLNVYSAAA